MARYKLLTQYGYPQLEIGEVYEENKILAAPYITVLYMADRYPKDWQLVGDRKIIGYKAPFDLHSINIKSGELCTLGSTGNEYVFKNHTYLPKEIVEQWEPVYESTYPDITINGYKWTFYDRYVKFGCAEIDSDLFVTLNKSKLIHSNREIESVTIGKGTFTKDQIKEIAQYYINKK